jgi:hypothetical protein
MSADSQGFNIHRTDGYIHLETWGVPTVENVAEPVSAALDMANREHVDKLLDDIRKVDANGISLFVQAKGVNVLWKLKQFKKVAIVLAGEEMNWMLESSLEALAITGLGNIKGFSDIESADAWLRSDSKKQR